MTSGKLVKESNEVVTWPVKIGFNVALSFTHQESFASFKQASLTVGSILS
jgi:hypothetical protein